MTLTRKQFLKTFALGGAAAASGWPLRAFCTHSHPPCSA